MLITRTSKVSGIERTIDLPITQDQLENWYNGMLVQDAFPNLTNSQREFILSGITDEEWNVMFPQENPLELGIIHQDVAEMFAERFAANNDGVPIPIQPEYRPPSSRIYSTNNIAPYKFHKLRPVLKYLNENIYLAGGSLRTLLKCSGEQVSDFDFFFKKFEEVLPLRTRLEVDGWENTYECPQGFLYTYKKGNHKLQLICETEYSSANLLVGSFDLSPCLFVYHDGVLTFVREAIRSVFRKRLRVNNVTFPVATMKRIIKYEKKGYSIGMGAEDFCRLVSNKTFSGNEWRQYID